MTNNLTSDQIKKRLDELEILENREKEKLEILRNQKKSEIKENISDKALDITEEEKKLMEIFKNKTPEEVRKILKKEKNKPKMKKLFHKILKIITILWVTGGLVFYIYNYGKDEAKRKANEKIEETIKKWNEQDSIAKISTRITITPDILKQQIWSDKLTQWISYEDLSMVVNAINIQETREQVIELLRNGKLIETQELFGMKRDSKYPSNMATGKIDRNSLKRFSNWYTGLYGKELLENQEIAQDVKDIYQKFVSGEINNNNENYIIISKTDYHLYLLTKEHKLLSRQVVLLGEDMGEKGERVPYAWYKTNKGVIYHDKEVNTNTPSWLFIINKKYTLTDKYIGDTINNTKNTIVPLALILVPIDEKTYKIDKTKYELNKYALEIHPIYQPPKNLTAYKDAIETIEIEDNAKSHGCINTGEAAINIDNTNTSGKNIVVITDDKK